MAHGVDVPSAGSDRRGWAVAGIGPTTAQERET